MLRDGSTFARWTIDHVGPLEAGAVAVTVHGGDDHQKFELEVLARDTAPGAPRAPGESRFFAVYLRNGGNGERGTVEEHGLAAMTLASILERNETAAAAAPFLTLSQRLTAFPDQLGQPATATL